jgi:hypothetical protein
MTAPNERVLDVLDAMPAEDLDRLLVVQEHEGVIAFVWDGSWWQIRTSIALQCT